MFVWDVIHYLNCEMSLALPHSMTFKLFSIETREDFFAKLLAFSDKRPPATTQSLTTSFGQICLELVSLCLPALPSAAQGTFIFLTPYFTIIVSHLLGLFKTRMLGLSHTRSAAIRKRIVACGVHLPRGSKHASILFVFREKKFYSKKVFDVPAAIFVGFPRNFFQPAI